ncbi:hypothetical protein CY34DRAFT_109297 [Suillus luteus UH-Slu-Lm8-n1]|uniref:Uncharacterized protein n=1 Tax=Suillus luteus UH-Slu-Lm8-n1 TaxID=930992 RepID=A0A0D0AFU2_9AGAM|nr:hypothetical protein CY34DRAFT_109297 [Suillus luteus UH-Slu-Lm8-n1]
MPRCSVGTVTITEESFPITAIWQSIEPTMPSIYLSLGLSLALIYHSVALMYTGRQPFHFLNAPTNASQSTGFDTSDLPDPNVLNGPPMGQDPSFYNTQMDNSLPTSGSNDQFPDLSTYYKSPAAITFPDDDTFLNAQMGGQPPSTIFSDNQFMDLNVYDSQVNAQPSPLPYPTFGFQMPPTSPVRTRADISWPPDASSHSGPPPPYLHGLPPPVLSSDGISSVPIGFKDVPQFRLGESSLPPKVVLPPSSRKRRENKFIAHPYQHRQKFKRRGKAAEVHSGADPSMGPSQPDSESGQFSYLSSCLGPLVYDDANDIHVKIMEEAQKIYLKSTLNKCSLLEEGERRQEVRTALLSATSPYDEESGKAWTTMNEGALYKMLSEPSGNIMSSCKKIVRNKVQSGGRSKDSLPRVHSRQDTSLGKMKMAIGIRSKMRSYETSSSTSYRNLAISRTSKSWIVFAAQLLSLFVAH